MGPGIVAQQILFHAVGQQLANVLAELSGGFPQSQDLTRGTLQCGLIFPQPRTDDIGVNMLAEALVIAQSFRVQRG